ncbi:15-hydroxyprostaglandin dehydrogenase [nad(+)] [Holotrichia oblita]|uniref:15-hydroxyprostaglandin dehydrogenase [nad(+)] n=1 Tax=Holotrichia oblita TaxID=644536 RepID=A0ACB9TX16_HOLOL|nr:15-hydroxyprostaglandin dehydrogenase [nad(+)] [Holotrichia oblita]
MRKGVTLVDVDEAKGKDAVDALSLKYGKGKIIFVRADVVNKKDLEDAMKKTVEKFGHFDILINNAGVMNDTIWEKEVDINIKGVVNGCILGLEEYLPKYNSGTEPVIVNIASTAGLTPLYFLPVYTSTKHAVIGLGKALAMRENCGVQKVKLMTLCPGATLTTLIDNLESRAFTPRLTETVKHFFEQYPEEVTQNPESVATAVVKILENGGNGSVWVVQGGELYEIEIPSFTDYKKLRQL